METFTIREAAEHCGLGYQLMRKRVDRGTLRTVKRDGVRLVPRAELERAGLWPGSQPQQAAGQELEHLRAELAQTRAELATLRALPAQLDAERQARELAEQAAHEQRAHAATAHARLDAAEAERQAAERARVEAAAAMEPLTTGGLVAGVRALLVLRRQQTEQPGPSASRGLSPSPRRPRQPAGTLTPEPTTSRGRRESPRR